MINNIEKLLTNVKVNTTAFPSTAYEACCWKCGQKRVAYHCKSTFSPTSQQSRIRVAQMKTMDGLKEGGFTHAFFGDIVLEDLKIQGMTVGKSGNNARFPLEKEI